MAVRATEDVRRHLRVHDAAAKELAEVQAGLDELAGDNWLDDGELSNADKTALDAALADYQKNPDTGSSWKEVKGRIQGRLRR